jgi:regulator of protease activity HflC (stomatin/prohibitin superfamily)
MISYVMIAVVVAAMLAASVNIREILHIRTEEWGIKLTTVELKDIQLPNTMKRAMARQAAAERHCDRRLAAA